MLTLPQAANRPQIQSAAHLVRDAVQLLSNVVADLRQLHDDDDLGGIRAVESLLMAAVVRDAIAVVENLEHKLYARRGEEIAALSNVVSFVPRERLP